MAALRRVCMLAYTLYPFDARVRREAETLAAQPDFAVTVLCLKMSPRPRTYSLRGVQVRELNAGKYAGGNPLRYLASYARFLLASCLSCSKLFLQGRVDVVHVHNMPNLLVLAAILPRLAGRPLILDMHDSMPDVFASKFAGLSSAVYRLLALEERLSAGLCDAVICVNDVHSAVVAGRGIPAGKIRVFLNVPDHRLFAHPALPPRSRTNPGCFRMAYHGTIEERLGIGLAVEALAGLRAHIDGLELHFWGGRRYSRELHERSCRLGVNDLVHWHPQVPVEQLPVVLADVQLGLVPYTSNRATELSLPVKLLEYLTLGIPVVSARLQAIARYFPEDAISYYQPDDVESLRQAILRLYQDSTRRQTQRLQAQLFLDRFGWKSQSREFVRFFQQMLNGRRRRGERACRFPSRI